MSYPNPRPINVLSLFDGISCAKLALDKAEIPVAVYHSSEISRPALKIQNYNFSADTSFHPIGDVREIRGEDYSHVDLVIFGSPCTNLSSIGNRTGFEENNESSLFFEAIRIIKEIKGFKAKGSKLDFLMENVSSMTIRNRDLITEELETIFPGRVQMIKIDSEVCSPGHRRRFYWTSIDGISQPERLDIFFQDILVNGYTNKEKANVILSNNVTLTNGIHRHHKMSIGNIIYKTKRFADLPTEQKLHEYSVNLKQSNYCGKSGSAVDEYAFSNGYYRIPSVLESERLMTIPEGHVSNVPDVSRTEKHKCIGLGYTVDVIAHLLRPMQSTNPIQQS